MLNIRDSFERQKTNIITALIILSISFVLFSAVRLFFRGDFNLTYSLLISSIMIVAYFVAVRAWNYFRKEGNSASK